jgi:asparagine synthase (glutamine-hydrolysing)
MGVQFGRWNFDGMPPAPEYLARAEKLLIPYGPDGRGSCFREGASLLYFDFDVTNESGQITQPHTLKSGAVIAWDGRLDNRDELVRQLRGDLTNESADVLIVGTAYEHWGIECLARLLGDWAISIWDPVRRALTLAKDPIGTHPLYYSCESRHITWSTILKPLILLAGHNFKLDEEYLAGCVALYPAVHLTPYVGVHSVPPSSRVCLTTTKAQIQKYWDFDPEKKIRYQNDGDYEEHFRVVFEQSVRRRLRSKFPVLAELSGGMDSSSIVCMADKISAAGTEFAPRIDTVSYYDDSENSWDERPYFTAVEQQRGKTGCHIEITSNEIFQIQFDATSFVPTPGSKGRATATSQQFAECVRSRGNRVVLSGTGGDEVLGGVPTPIPELRDLIVQAKLRALARQLKTWALTKRKPWRALLLEALQGFLPSTVFGSPEYRRPAPWLDRNFVMRNRLALGGYEGRVRFFGRGLPSFQDNLSALDGLRRQLAFTDPPYDPVYERRYPYLDLDLLEFAFAIPREQHVRPGRRRSLMRRALAGIVPDALINRRRKAFPLRRPMLALSAERNALRERKQPLGTGLLGIVDTARLLGVLEKSAHGEEVAFVQVMRTLALEHWLGAVSEWTNGGMGDASAQPSPLFHIVSNTTV